MAQERLPRYGDLEGELDRGAIAYMYYSFLVPEWSGRQEDVSLRDYQTALALADVFIDTNPVLGVLNGADFTLRDLEPGRGALGAMGQWDTARDRQVMIPSTGESPQPMPWISIEHARKELEVLVANDAQRQGLLPWQKAQAEEKAVQEYAATQRALEKSEAARAYAAEQQRAYDEFYAQARSAAAPGQVPLQGTRHPSYVAARQQHEAAREPLPALSTITDPVLEGIRKDISPAASRFFSRDMGNILADAGVTPSSRALAHQKATAFVPLGFGGWDADRTSPTFGEAHEAAQGLTLRDEEIGRLRRQNPDPAAQALAGIDFKQRFTSLTPEERGFQERTFRPRTRFL